MRADEIMTKDVITVSPDTLTAEIARRLLDRKISALPVVDKSGSVVGMVSEGDLIGRGDAEREARRDWWLSLIAEGNLLHPDFLASLHRPELTAGDVMSGPVVSVTETTEAKEIARLLATHRIKRVPVVREGRVVGIVSRADVLRALAGEQAELRSPEPLSRARNLLAEAIVALDTHYLHRHRDAAETSAAPQIVSKETLAATNFHELVADFEHQKVERHDAAGREAAEQRQREVKELIDRHVNDETWNTIMHRAREAAEHGEQEVMLLRFPSELCSDRGRAINAPLPDWPKTLRGEAAEIFLRWENDLKPGGFQLSARVLDFPGGQPGDIGLFLIWGQ